MVDRPDVEVRQRMELTGTNRSCGLTTYYFLCSLALASEAHGESSQLVRVAPGEGASPFSNRAETHEDNACGCLFLEETIGTPLSACLSDPLA